MEHERQVSGNERLVDGLFQHTLCNSPLDPVRASHHLVCSSALPLLKVVCPDLYARHCRSSEQKGQDWRGRSLFKESSHHTTAF